MERHCRLSRNKTYTEGEKGVAISDWGGQGSTFWGQKVEGNKATSYFLPQHIIRLDSKSAHLSLVFVSIYHFFTGFYSLLASLTHLPSLFFYSLNHSVLITGSKVTTVAIAEARPAYHLPLALLSALYYMTALSFKRRNIRCFIGNLCIENIRAFIRIVRWSSATMPQSYAAQIGRIVCLIVCLKRDFRCHITALLD